MFILKTRQPAPHGILVWRIGEIGPPPVSILLIRSIIDYFGFMAPRPSLEVFLEETIDITIRTPFYLVEHRWLDDAPSLFATLKGREWYRNRSAIEGNKNACRRRGPLILDKYLFDGIEADIHYRSFSYLTTLGSVCIILYCDDRSSAVGSRKLVSCGIWWTDQGMTYLAKTQNNDGLGPLCIGVQTSSRQGVAV